jgi:hypothetical protein
MKTIYTLPAPDSMSAVVEDVDEGRTNVVARTVKLAHEFDPLAQRRHRPAVEVSILIHV